MVALSAAAFGQSTTQQSLPSNPSATTGPVNKPLPLPDTFSAQSHPAPTPTPGAGKLAVSGKFRAYYFTRLNRVANAANPDRHALEFGIAPHLDYRFGTSNFNIGYTYGGATGFGFNGPAPSKNTHVDNTLPGFPLDQPIQEAYVQYKSKYDTITFGDQILNYPWMPNSDSRIQPASYQAADGSFQLAPGLVASLTREFRFEQRNSSNFEPNTLLTAFYPGTPFAGTPSQTPGTMRVGLSFKPSTRASLMAENYQVYNIANITYAEGKYGFDPYSTANPYLAVQYLAQNSEGKNVLGRVDNHTIGGQIGVNVAKGLLLAVSGDFAPWQYRYVAAPTIARAERGTFIPAGGTGAAELIAPGLYKVAYGGVISPFTDSLGTDPLYTTQITQGLADRRSAGNSYKAALVYTTPNKQLKVIADEGWYQYSNDIVRNLTSEFNVDGTYYFMKVKPGPYHGVFARIRIAPRQQPTLPYNFEYQRFQLEYDF